MLGHEGTENFNSLFNSHRVRMNAIRKFFNIDFRHDPFISYHNARIHKVGKDNHFAIDDIAFREIVKFSCPWEFGMNKPYRVFKGEI